MRGGQSTVTAADLIQQSLDNMGKGRNRRKLNVPAPFNRVSGPEYGINGF